MKCKYCNEIIDEDSTFCAYCGKNVKEESSLKTEENVNMRRQIELQLHEQYVVKSNSYISGIVVLITAMLAILGTYGYVFSHTLFSFFNKGHSFIRGENSNLFVADILMYTTLIAVFILYVCFHICVYQGTAQRKEQFVIDFIRRKYYMIEDRNNNTLEKPFENWNPFNKKKTNFIQGLYNELIKFIILATSGILLVSLCCYIYSLFVCEIFKILPTLTVLLWFLFPYMGWKLFNEKYEEYLEIEKKYK